MKKIIILTIMYLCFLYCFINATIEVYRTGDCKIYIGLCCILCMLSLIYFELKNK